MVLVTRRGERARNGEQYDFLAFENLIGGLHRWPFRGHHSELGFGQSITHLDHDWRSFA
jgi:hypothetical protein